ncbi:exosome complex component RRP43-like [Sitophilus oryzae]|uniref:Ribosomal RNA-processing protein 43 n=1 Tax=Sitophilus oryzae TaxID=7048 RepID=A0A6J2YKH9_SITOR|nr:exosome complex component RRP43-like [Sitophilus oryzae]
MAEQYKSLHPAKYYRDHLKHDIRPDGRELSDFRPVVINVGSIKTADGSSIVKIGNTTVVCGIKAEISRPKADAATKGFLVPNVELSPVCSSKFKPGPPSDQAQVLTQIIADIVGNSQCINLEELCIFPDKIAWCLYADLICIDYDGSLIDACALALISCLKVVSLPEVSYDPSLDKQQVNLEKRTPINVNSVFVSTTFAIFDDKLILADPTVEEENLCTGTLTIVTCNDELCYVHKPGGSPLVDEQMSDCIEKCMNRSNSIKKLIKTAILENI